MYINTESQLIYLSIKNQSKCKPSTIEKYHNITETQTEQYITDKTIVHRQNNTTHVKQYNTGKTIQHRQTNSRTQVTETSIHKLWQHGHLALLRD